MARFRILSMRWQPPHLVFEIEPLDGEVTVGQHFRVWSAAHAYDYEVVEVHRQHDAVLLSCTAGYLHLLKPDEQHPDLFSGAVVDTEDPAVARQYAYTAGYHPKRKPWWLRLWSGSD